MLASQASISIPQKGKVSFKLTKKQALLTAVVITLATMVLEFVYSAISGSLMLFSDAIHMLSHAASLAVSLVATILAAKQVSKRYPFGFKRIEILAAFVNGITLAIFCGFIVYECVGRLFNPSAIEVTETLSVAIIGLVVNLLTAFVLSLAGLEDLNTKSAFMHMLADTFSSVAIIVGAIIINYTSWFFIDALLGIVIAIVVAKWSISLLKRSSVILLGAAPEGFEIEKVRQDLYNKFDTILTVDDVKVMEITEDETHAFVKLKVYPAEVYEYKYLKREIRKRLEKKFAIHSVSIELDW